MVADGAGASAGMPAAPRAQSTCVHWLMGPVLHIGCLISSVLEGLTPQQQGRILHAALCPHRGTLPFAWVRASP